MVINFNTSNAVAGGPEHRQDFSSHAQATASA